MKGRPFATPAIVVPTRRKRAVRAPNATLAHGRARTQPTAPIAWQADSRAPGRAYVLHATAAPILTWRAIRAPSATLVLTKMLKLLQSATTVSVGAGTTPRNP